MSIEKAIQESPKLLEELFVTHGGSIKDSFKRHEGELKLSFTVSLKQMGEAVQVDAGIAYETHAKIKDAVELLCTEQPALFGKDGIPQSAMQHAKGD